MKKRRVSVAAILVKLLVILLLLGFWLAAGRRVLKLAAAWNDFFFNEAREIQSCDYYYYQKNYGGLREELSMDGLDGDAFGKYHEAVQGFEDYQQYLQYKKADAAGVSGAAAKAEQYRLLVIGNAENCEYPENQEQLDQYKADAGASAFDVMGNF